MAVRCASPDAQVRRQALDLYLQMVEPPPAAAVREFAAVDWPFRSASRQYDGQSISFPWHYHEAEETMRQWGDPSLRPGWIPSWLRRSWGRPEDYRSRRVE